MCWWPVFLLTFFTVEKSKNAIYYCSLLSFEYSFSLLFFLTKKVSKKVKAKRISFAHSPITEKLRNHATKAASLIFLVIGNSRLTHSCFSPYNPQCFTKTNNWKLFFIGQQCTCIKATNHITIIWCK